jgi:hypothetical protein
MSTVDFNRHRPPFLEVSLFDKDETVLQVTPPTVDLQEELRASAADFTALLNGGNEEHRKVLWDLAARLMSCNRNWLKITPADLRKKYKLVEEDLVVFFQEYVSFLNGIENAKN